VAQVRQRLGAARFDQAFSAGSRLTQREAVAIVRDQNAVMADPAWSPWSAGPSPGLRPGIPGPSHVAVR
jgi:hypothetical protein